jgi:hypothetical protein
MINNYILTAIFVILTINQSAAQSKKVQIEVLNTSLDSLNQSLAKEKILTKQLESQLSILAEILEKKETELITAKNSLLNSNIKTTELTQKLNLIRDSIEIYRNSIKKLTFTRDFSNGTFNDDELMFIINYFKRELKQKFSFITEEELESKLLIDSTGITIHSEGELGYVPAFDFKRNYNKSLAGDLDNDGTHEILFNVGVTAGGTAYWGEIYCLKIFPNNNHILFKIEAPCACTSNYECRKPSTEIINVKDNVLTIESRCFFDSDPNCCPSLTIKSRYKFIDTHLILIK